MQYETSASAEEKVTSLFQPDTLLSDQYFSGHKSKQLDPGKRLMLAVLQDAVLCYQDNVLAEETKKKALFREAEIWIMEESKDWIFSFENVCEALGLNPRYVRAGLKGWKQKRLGNGGRCSRKKNQAA
jgi:hypothetical protein